MSQVILSHNASIDGSGESAHMRRFARAFNAFTYTVDTQVEAQTKSRSLASLGSCVYMAKQRVYADVPFCNVLAYIFLLIFKETKSATMNIFRKKNFFLNHL